VGVRPEYGEKEQKSGKGSTREKKMGGGRDLGFRWAGAERRGRKIVHSAPANKSKEREGAKKKRKVKKFTKETKKQGESNCLFLCRTKGS